MLRILHRAEIGCLGSSSTLSGPVNCDNLPNQNFQSANLLVVELKADVKPDVAVEEVDEDVSLEKRLKKGRIKLTWSMLMKTINTVTRSTLLTMYILSWVETIKQYHRRHSELVGWMWK